jgi:hypothetical protein
MMYSSIKPLFFEKRDYKAVALILDQTPLVKETLSTDLFIELFAIASFTYANLEDYAKSLKYSSELLDFFFTMNQPYDEELVENIVKVKYVSLCAFGRKNDAYRLVKRAISKFGYVDEMLEQEFKKERDRRANKIVKIAGYSLSTFAIVTGILQVLFRVMPLSLSLPLEVVTILLLYSLFLKEKGLFWKMLIKMV